MRLRTHFLESRQISDGFYWMAATHNSAYHAVTLHEFLDRRSKRRL